MREGKTYSHTDIQRYLQKKMLPKEMHEFERALMDDPFLADAIEGFAASDTTLASQHLQEIENKIMGREEKAKVVNVFLQKTPWWQFAAIVMVIVSAGIITYEALNKSSSSKNIALVNASRVTQELIKKQDTIKASDAPVTRLNIPAKDLVQTMQSPATALSKTNAEVTSALSRKDNTNMAMTYEQKMAGSVAAQSPVANDEVVSKPMQSMHDKAEKEFNGKVVNEAGEPLANATVSISAAGKDVATVTNAEGKFNFKSADSVVKVGVSSAGSASANAEVKSNQSSNNIALRKNTRSLSDVVVTQAMTNNKARKASKEKAAVIAEPEGGWQNFKVYLNNQVDSIKSADNSYNQNVVLEFSVDKKGLPQNIKSQNKVDRQTEEKAKQILLNGPKWTNNSSKQKVVVTVPAHH